MGHQVIWRQSSQFPKTKSALHFFSNAYQSKSPPRGLVWMIHGLGEHMGRYWEWANFLCQIGFDVAGIDLPGHGLSKQQGQKRLASLPESLREIKEGHSFLLEQVYDRAHRPDRWQLMGHSMGGILALLWTLDIERVTGGQSFAQKLLISSPPLALRLNVPGYKVMLAERLCEWAPDVLLDAGFSARDLSRDPVSVYENQVDPLCFAKASPRLFLSLQTMSEKCKDSARLVDVPILLVVGEDDPIVLPQAIEHFYRSVSSHKKLILLKQNVHECFNELGRKHLYEGVVEWFTT